MIKRARRHSGVGFDQDHVESALLDQLAGDGEQSEELLAAYPTMPTTVIAERIGCPYSIRTV